MKTDSKLRRYSKKRKSPFHKGQSNKIQDGGNNVNNAISNVFPPSAPSNINAHLLPVGVAHTSSSSTQNQNEAINGILCSKCPKTKFCGKRKVLLAVSETVSHFNTGTASRATLMEAVAVNPSCNMLTALHKEDRIRIQHAAKKISERARVRRRKLRADKKSKTDDVVNYQTGSFGLSCQPEDLTVVHSQKRKADKIQIDSPKLRKCVEIKIVDERCINVFYFDQH